MVLVACLMFGVSCSSLKEFRCILENWGFMRLLFWEETCDDCFFPEQLFRGGHICNDVELLETCCFMCVYLKNILIFIIYIHPKFNIDTTRYPGVSKSTHLKTDTCKKPHVWYISIRQISGLYISWNTSIVACATSNYKLWILGCHTVMASGAAPIPWVINMFDRGSLIPRWKNVLRL